VGFGTECGPYVWSNLRHLPSLYAEQDYIYWLSSIDVLNGLHRLQGEVPCDALDSQSALLQRLELLATRDKYYVLAGLRQSAAKVAPNSSCAEYDYAHTS
jgi:hypothetical protein